MSRPPELHRHLQAWDRHIVARFHARLEGSGEPAESVRLTLRAGDTAALEAVLADVVARAPDSDLVQARAEGGAAIRDAAIETAIAGYLAGCKPPAAATGTPSGSIGDHIVDGMIVRGDPAHRRELIAFDARLSGALLRALDESIATAFDEVDVTRLAWEGDLVDDVRSSLIEAVLAGWIGQRSSILGVRPCSGARTRGSARR